MLNAHFYESKKILELAIENYKKDGGLQEIRSFDGAGFSVLRGENQAIMSCIGIISDMGHDGLFKVETHG